MFVSLNNCNIILFINKTKSSEDFDEVHKVVLDSIYTNMESLLHTGKHGAINVSDPTTMGYYDVKYTPDAFTFLEDITTYGQVSKSGKLEVRAE